MVRRMAAGEPAGGELSERAGLDAAGLALVARSVFDACRRRHAPLAVFDAAPMDEWLGMTVAQAVPDADDRQAAIREVNALFGSSIPAPAEACLCGDFCAAAYRQWLRGERRMSFLTSGSTGLPKACPHAETALMQEAAALAPFFAPCRRVLLTVPCHHLYGCVFGIFMPRACSLPVGTRPFLPHALMDAMRPGDALIAIPQLLERFVSLLNSGKAGGETGRAITLVSATAPLRPATGERLAALGFRLIEIYGSSETGVVGWRERMREPYRLLPYWQRGADAGDAQMLVRTMPDGSKRAYPLQDVIVWGDDGGFVPAGRRDRAVQVAGVNVHPAHVEETLAAHEGVAQCRVRLMRPEEGDRLKAFIVPKGDWDARSLRSSLAVYLRERLRDAERPRSLTFGRTLPRNALGKDADWDVGGGAGSGAS